MKPPSRRSGSSQGYADTSPPPERPVVCDTVVVNYFLATGEIGLLARLVGGVVAIPRVVFDPDEEDDAREEAMSELRRGWHLHRRRCEEPSTPDDIRARSASALRAFERLPELVGGGTLEIIDLSEEELRRYAELRDRAHVRRFGLVAGLGPGEAAVLAVCAQRDWQPATDDTDAIRVATTLLPGVRPLRIRALLTEAVACGVIELGRARAIHEEMRARGFWDTETL